MAEQDRLQLVGQSFASLADSESALFARELGRVLAVLERDLLALVQGVREGNRGILSRVGRLLTLRREIRLALEQAGYQALITRASIDVVEGMARVASRSRIAQAGAALGRVSPQRLQGLANLMRADLLGIGDTLAHQVWRSAVLGIYSNRPAQTIVAELAKAIEKSRAQAQTLFDTQTSVIGREIVAAEETEPDQAYLYVGPTDGRVRDWCLEHLGQVMTRERIEALDNGQLPNPFLTGGGYACRHSWLAVSDPDLIALVNTGERAPGYAERVSEAREARKVLKFRRRRAA